MVQLPGVNTTQFGWVLSKLPNNPKPIGKVYKPESSGKGHCICRFSQQKGNSCRVSNFQGNYRKQTGALGWAIGYCQKKVLKNSKPANLYHPTRKNNLWEPVPEDRGPYGDFGNIAHDKSVTLWASMNRNMIAAAGAFVAAFVVALQSGKNKL